jgi:uncharacterized protein
MTPFTHLPSLQLLTEGGVFLTDTRTLVVADVHLGKSATFRAQGLPIPEGDTARDLQRLLDLVQRCQAANLIIAGDFFHAPSSMTASLESALAEFLELLAIPLTLVIGNHDAKIRRLPQGICCVDYYDVSNAIRVIHDPADASGEVLHLCGHWHPVVKIADGRRTSLRLPCYLKRKNILVLPAFGSFTGGAIVRPLATDRIFVALRETVIELPETLLAGA